MPWNSFGRSTIFAALAALVVSAWLPLAAPLFGGRLALMLYLAAVIAIYVTGLGPSRMRGLRAGLVTAVLGCGLVLVARTLGEVALGLAVLLAAARSGFFYRSPPARAFAVEATLVIVGLLFARFLAGSSIVSVMLAVWGFLLVQSLFFLVGGVRARSASSAHRDPFDAAHQRAVLLLDRDGI